MSRFLDANDIASQARGRWVGILRHLAGNELGKAVENYSGTLKSSAREYCPIHGGSSGEAFTLFKDADETGGGVCNSCGTFPDGFKLLMWIHKWDFRYCLEQVADSLSIKSSHTAQTQYSRKPYEPKQLTSAQLKQAQKLISKRDRIISECLPISHRDAKPALRYFARRGLENLRLFGNEVMFHKGLESWYKCKKTDEFINEGLFPCIVSILRNSKGEVHNIHRTFITEEGYKANVKSVKKLGAAIDTHPISGCGIHISPGDRVMAVAEGLETTLAVKKAYPGLSVHCTANATLLGNWKPPYGVEKLFIFADNDLSNTGEEKALKLYDRLAPAIQCFVCLPLKEEDKDNVDWADVLEIYGIEGFPELPM